MQLKCPICKKAVAAGAEDFPFCSDRCRLIDLGKWASGGYRISSPVLDPELLDDLKTAVQQTLARREELKGVDVDVKNGVARLTGTVRSEQQRLDAAIAARSTAGVRAVEDDLRISAAKQAS